MAPLIEFRNVYKIYRMGDTEVHAIDGISMSIERGEFVAIVGQSGSGKSTCMNIIGCLDVPTSGQYLLAGQDVVGLDDDDLAAIRNKMLGFIFQQYNLLPKMSVLENVEVSLMYAGVPKSERDARAKKTLARIGPHSFRAVSSSAFRLRGRWPETPRSFWLTSRPARLTAGPDARYSRFCRICTAREIPLCLLLMTIPLPAKPSASSVSRTAG